MAKGKFRPTGHLGADTTKAAAEQAVLRSHLGPYYRFVQVLGGMPIIYGILTYIVYREWLYAIVALVYAFLFHIIAMSYFAARSNLGLETCPKNTFGYIWSKLFIPRAVFDHMVMMCVVIWVSPVWFLVSGVVLYLIDYAITIAITLKWSMKDKTEDKEK